MITKNLHIEIKPSSVSHEVAIIEFDGEMISGTITMISECFDTVISQKKKFIIVDMTKIISISSAALGELMGGRKRMVELGGDLVLTGMSLDVRTKFNLMGANKIFRIFNDNRTAINAYKWEYKHQAENVHLTFPPNLKLVPPVRQLISRIARQKGYGNRDSFRIETIVDEICNNAVEHGAKGSTTDIDLSINIDKDKIEINVTNISDPDKIESLKALMGPASEHVSKPEDKRGRGLSLIKMLSNNLSVDFLENGTCVHVTKVREE